MFHGTPCIFKNNQNNREKCCIVYFNLTSTVLKDYSICLLENRSKYAYINNMHIHICTINLGYMLLVICSLLFAQYKHTNVKLLFADYNVLIWSGSHNVWLYLCAMCILMCTNKFLVVQCARLYIIYFIFILHCTVYLHVELYCIVSLLFNKHVNIFFVRLYCIVSLLFNKHVNIFL